MFSITDKKIKLDAIDDWHTWNVAFIARASFLWEKIDCNAVARLPFLTKPVKPDPANERYEKEPRIKSEERARWQGNGNGALQPEDVPDMTDKGRQRYKMDQDTYLVDLAEFKMESRSVAELKAWVIETVNKRFLVPDCSAWKGIDEWYANLQNRFAVNQDYFLDRVATRLARAHKTYAFPRSKSDVKDWVDEWEAAVDEAKVYKLHVASDVGFLWTSFRDAVSKDGYHEWCEEFERRNREDIRGNKDWMAREMANEFRHKMMTDGSRVSSALLTFYKYGEYRQPS